MNKFFSVMAADHFQAGCAGGEGRDPGEADGGAPLGAAEQGLRVSLSPTYTYGAQTGGDRLACTRTQSNGAVCSMPNKLDADYLAFSYCFDSSWNNFPAEKTRAQNIMLELEVTFDNTINVSGDSNHLYLVGSCSALPPDDHGPDLIIVRGPVSGSSTKITQYVQSTLSPTGDPALVEVPVALPGSYVTHFASVLRIDMADILANIAGTATENLVIRHALGYGIRTFFGVGGRTDNTHTLGSVLLAPTSSNRAIGTAGDICRMASYLVNHNAAQFSINSSAVCLD